MTELPESHKLTTVTTGSTKDCDILIVTPDCTTSDWIKSVQKSIRRHESRKVIKGKNRNAPCPCGCGQKLKRCRRR